VRLAEGSQLVVPGWMLDPVICSQLPQEGKPRVGWAALLKLRELIDGARLLCPNSAAESDAATLTGGIDASQKSETDGPAIDPDVPSSHLNGG